MRHGSMQKLMAAGVVLLACWISAAVAADEPFDVRVVAESTTVLAGTQPIGTVQKGTRLTVTESDADWYLINVPGTNPRQQGWIRRSDAVVEPDVPFDVTVTASSTRIMAGSQPTGVVLRGTRLTVTDSDADWYLVDVPGDKPLRRGWIRRSDVRLASAAPRLIVQLGHQEGVTSVAFSPDRKYVLTGGGDGTARLWEAASGSEIRKFAEDADEIIAVAFSPNGKQVLTGSWDGTARLWSVASGKEIRSFNGHPGEISSVAFSPNGQQVLIGIGTLYGEVGGDTGDSTARLWDVASGREIRRFKGHSDGVSSVAFSPNGKQIATGGHDKTARLWDVASGREVRRLQGHAEPVNSVAFSPNGEQVLTGAGTVGGTPVEPQIRDNTARLWDAATGSEVRRFEGHSSPVTSVAFSPDGMHVLTGSWDNTVRLWNAASGKEIRRFEGHSEVTSVAFSPDGKVLTGSADSKARLWDAATGTKIRKFEGHAAPVELVYFSPDGKRVLICSEDNSVRVWDTAIGKEIRKFDGLVALSPDGNRVLTSDENKMAGPSDAVGGKEIGNPLPPSVDKVMWTIWDTASGREIRKFEVGGNLPVGGDLHVDGRYAHLAALSPDGKQVLTESWDRTARLWEVASGKEIRRFEGHADEVTSVAFSPDGKLVLTGDGSTPIPGLIAAHEYTVRIWDATSGKEIVRFVGHSDRIRSVALSSDGKQVLTGSEDKTARLWNAAGGQEVRKFEGHAFGVSSVAFSPNGQQYLTGSLDGAARLWNAADGREIRKFEGHGSPVTSVAFSPDGKRLLTGNFEGTATLWDAASGEELCSFVSFANGDWAVVDSAGRFDASNHGKIDGLHWVVANEPIGLAQLKDRYYDPGLLAKKMGFSKDPLREVEAFDNPKLYPEVALTRPAAGQTKFDIHLTNHGGGIGQVTVRINGEDAIADARGPQPDPNAAAITLPIDLADDPRLKPGEENDIEVVAFNADGLVSSRGTRIPYHDPRAKRPVEKPEVWALVVGVSHYQGGAIDLRYPAKDAEDFATALRIAVGRLCGAEKFHLTLLTSPLPDANRRPDNIAQPNASSRPTHDNILGALNAFHDRNKVKDSDILVVYLAGHGVTGSGADNSFYYLTCDAQQADSIDPEVRRQWSVSDLEMIKEIMEVPAQKRIMILDTCHSGKLIENLSVKQQREPDTSEVIALERIRDHTGFHVLAGCAADRASYEASHYNQGVLTYSLLRGMHGEALKDGRFVDVWTLFHFAVDNVPRLAGDVQGIQEPQTYSDRGSTFPFGEITAADQPLIPLAKTRPLVLRVSFHDADDQDPLRFNGKLNDRFREITYGQSDPALEFVDADDLIGAFRVAGSYKVDGNNVTGIVRVALQAPETGKIESFPISGDKTKIAELVATIAAEVQNHLPKPTAVP
jgi:WD40 repeat protein